VDGSGHSHGEGLAGVTTASVCDYNQLHDVDRFTIEGRHGVPPLHVSRAVLWSQLSFHSGIRPGVQGAPTASIAFSTLERSPSISPRNCPSTRSNSCEAAA
jgi:hypothetical protein